MGKLISEKAGSQKASNRFRKDNKTPGIFFDQALVLTTGLLEIIAKTEERLKQ